MTPRVIAIIAVRILALYLILSGLAVFPAFIRVNFAEFFLLDPQYIIIIMGILIWFLAKPIANRIITLPTYYDLTIEDVIKICEIIKHIQKTA